MFSSIINWIKPEEVKFRESFFRQSFSQCGEDMIVDYIFSLRGITHPAYLDIGANHPYYLNNTALFYLRGCRGINVEANPGLIALFEKHRPLDTNIHAGVYSEKGEMDFYLMEDDTLSSFSKAECEKLVALGKKLRQTVKVSLITVNEIISTYCQGRFPDFLTLDVEGFDMDILRSIDWEKSWPKVICVESAEYSPTGAGEKRTDLIALLEGKGYYEYANTNLNSIMVKREFWFGS